MKAALENTLTGQHSVTQIPDGMSEAAAIDVLVANQRANGDPIDPAGARRFIRALVALGLLHVSAAP